MYSVKVSWPGQTFALAAANDSGGKKSRIRLSKEKRKTMIESFIRRYQSSNNGSFPSLNLTHKEVGGSFYTVREIVREIIQENRVLGPGQFDSEGQNNDLMTVNYPLGSIASEPLSHMFEKVSTRNEESLNETMVVKSENNGHFTKQFDLDVAQYSTEKSVGEIGEDEDRLSVNENLTNSEHSKEEKLVGFLNRNGKYDNVNEAGIHFASHKLSNVTSEEPSKSGVELDEESEKTGSLQNKVGLPTEEVQVETFPLTHEIDLDDDPGSSSINLEAEKVKSSNGTMVLDEASSIGSSSDPVMTKAADSSDVSGDSGGSADLMAQNAEVNSMVNQHLEVNPKNDSEDISYSLPVNDDTAIPYNVVNQLSPHVNTTSKMTDQITLQNASKAATFSENSNITSFNSVKESTVASDYDFKKDEKAKVGSSPPLNRIDLGSWKASKQEANPLLAFFKAFVDDFVKFWSE